jgi:hypothetical protein
MKEMDRKYVLEVGYQMSFVKMLIRTLASMSDSMHELKLYKNLRVENLECPLSWIDDMRNIINK